MNAPLSRLEKYWFDRLGCAPSDLRAGEVCVFAHGTDETPHNVIVFQKDGGCVVSAPMAWVVHLQKEFSDQPCDTVFDVTHLESFFKNEAQAVVGPAWLGETDLVNFVPCHDDHSREITADDEEAFLAFVQACDPADIRNSGMEWGRAPIIGVFEGDVLASVANYQVRADSIAHIGIVTRPDYRGKGLAKKAVSHITALALNLSYGVQYQTLMTNGAAIALCRQLGFYNFAQTIVVKLSR